MYALNINIFTLLTYFLSNCLLSIHDLQKTCGQLDQQYNSPSWPLSVFPRRLNRFFSSCWSGIYILYRVSHVSFELIFNHETIFLYELFIHLFKYQVTILVNIFFYVENAIYQNIRLAVELNGKFTFNLWNCTALVDKTLSQTNIHSIMIVS